MKKKKIKQSDTPVDGIMGLLELVICFLTTIFN